jgi:hypothetical protein
LRVYVETNFLLEIVLEQEEVVHAERLLELAAAGAVELVVPTVCALEARQTIHRRDREQRDLLDRVDRELVQLGRSQPLARAASEMRGVFVAATGSIRKREDELLRRLSLVGRWAVLDGPAINAAVSSEGLLLPDAMVLTSILQDAASRGTEAVFATKNSKDFGQPAVRRRLREVGCELVFSFADAVARSAGRS